MTKIKRVNGQSHAISAKLNREFGQRYIKIYKSKAIRRAQTKCNYSHSLGVIWRCGQLPNCQLTLGQSKLYTIQITLSLIYDH